MGVWGPARRSNSYSRAGNFALVSKETGGYTYPNNKMKATGGVLHAGLRGRKRTTVDPLYLIQIMLAQGSVVVRQRTSVSVYNTCTPTFPAMDWWAFVFHGEWER